MVTKIFQLKSLIILKVQSYPRSDLRCRPLPSSRYAWHQSAITFISLYWRKALSGAPVLLSLQLPFFSIVTTIMVSLSRGLTPGAGRYPAVGTPGVRLRLPSKCAKNPSICAKSIRGRAEERVTCLRIFSERPDNGSGSSS